MTVLLFCTGSFPKVSTYCVGSLQCILYFDFNGPFCNIFRPTPDEVLDHIGVSQDSVQDRHEIFKPGMSNNARGILILEFTDQASYQVRIT